MSGIYRTVRDEVEATWAANWPHPEVPVYWRENDTPPVDDPTGTPHFLRNEIDFGRERLIGFGGGRGGNLMVKYGSVLLRVFTSRALLSDDVTLDLLSAAEAVFRSARTGELSFIGGAASFDAEAQPGEENGNWYMRASLVVFEYRFVG